MNYFDNPAMSQSKLKDLKKSPAHFYAKHLAPNRSIEQPTAAMLFGTAVHMYILEPDKFLSQYVIAPDIDKRTKSGELKYEQFVLENQNKTIIKAVEYMAILAMRDALLKKQAGKFLLNDNGKTEQDIYWTDPQTGINCKALLDYSNKYFVDIKTTINASSDEFMKSIYNFGYYNQVAWYYWGYKIVHGTYPEGFIFIAMEKEPPYECGFYLADNTMLEIGMRENRKLLNLYNQCLTANHFPGYEDKIQSIGLPTWAIQRFDNNVTGLF